jgi:hypothetical protein
MQVQDCVRAEILQQTIAINAFESHFNAPID